MADARRIQITSHDVTRGISAGGIGVSGAGIVDGREPAACRIDVSVNDSVDLICSDHFALGRDAERARSGRPGIVDLGKTSGDQQEGMPVAVSQRILSRNLAACIDADERGCSRAGKVEGCVDTVGSEQERRGGDWSPSRRTHPPHRLAD